MYDIIKSNSQYQQSMPEHIFPLYCLTLNVMFEYWIINFKHRQVTCKLRTKYLKTKIFLKALILIPVSKKYLQTQLRIYAFR